jgi:carbonic anhydrase
MQGGDNGPNLNHLLDHIKPALDSAGKGADVDEVIRRNIELTTKRLTQHSTTIKKAVEEKALRIVPAYYHLDTGEVEF